MAQVLNKYKGGKRKERERKKEKEKKEGNLYVDAYHRKD